MARQNGDSQQSRATKTSPHQQNPLMFQAFEWYLPTQSTQNGIDARISGVKSSSRSHWQNLMVQLEELQSFGITSIWIPPACKATNPTDNGYGIYDLYDLGEFDTKGSVATKWGSKAELQSLCSKAKSLGISIIFDAVLNHRAAADGSEDVPAIRVDPKSRDKEVDKSSRTIEAWTRFDYSARGNRYSSMKYHKDHFSGVDWDSKTQEKAIFKFTGTRPDGTKKDWASDVSTSEYGNFDYLMFADVDFGHPEVQQDVKHWGKWLIDQLPGVGGIRLDAIKHYSAKLQQEFVKAVKVHAERHGEPFFFVGEYWLDDSKFLSKFLKPFNNSLHLFDVRLVYNFHNISTGRIRNLSKVFDGTLVAIEPKQTVTFVTNHDTQTGQSLAAPVEPWFIPHAYALILLREEGLPCVFWGDLYGTHGPHARIPACGGRLARLIKIRQYYAYGQQICGMKAPSLTSSNRKSMAWQRKFEMQNYGHMCLVVLLSISWSWEKKKICVGNEFAGQIFTDAMGWCWSGVEIDHQGYGVFPVGPRSICVWTPRDAPYREDINHLIYPPEPETDDEEESQHDVVALMDA